MAVVGEQIEPFLEPVLVDQTGLVHDKADQVLVGRRVHRVRESYIDIVMNFDQARN